MTTIIRNPSACCGTGPTLRRFELIAAKASASPTATAKFLDDAGNLVGDPVTLYDPMGKFYGKPASYYGSGQGFRGIALQRTDLSGIEADRWEIVDMEGFAESVLVTWVDSSPTHEWQLTSFFGDHWEWKRPVNDNASLTIDDPAGVGSAKQNGDKGMAHLKNPDTSPPTYELRTIKSPAASKVAYTAKVTTRISPGRADAPVSGPATIYRIEDGTVTSLGTQTLYNPYKMSVEGDCACVPLPNTNEAKFLVSGIPGEELQIFALSTSNPCTLTLEDNKLTLKLHGKLVSIPARLDQDNVDKTCDIGAVVCGEVV